MTAVARAKPAVCPARYVSQRVDGQQGGWEAGSALWSQGGDGGEP